MARTSQVKVCSVSGCTRPYLAKGYCSLHYKRCRQRGAPGGVESERQRGRVCSVDGCGRRHFANGLCAMHNLRRKKTGVVGSAAKLYGHGHLIAGGYLHISKKGHPNSNARGFILEHIFVMSEKLGRPLAKGETVHHKNGDRLDNRPENLELWSSNHRSGQRVSDQIAFAIQTILRYLPDKATWPQPLRHFRQALLNLPPEAIPKHWQLNLF